MFSRTRARKKRLTENGPAVIEATNKREKGAACKRDSTHIQSTTGGGGTSRRGASAADLYY
jgi:hypothetical protein